MQCLICVTRIGPKYTQTYTEAIDITNGEVSEPATSTNSFYLAPTD